MSEKRLVWDLPLRLFHWLLVVSLVASWYTAEMSSKGEFIGLFGQQYAYAEVHFWLGYWALGMILFRLIWGFVGPKHARFASFFPGPRRFARYARGFFRRNTAPTVGHNPMGGAVVLLMLLMVGAQASTGLFLVDNTDIFSAPYHGAVSGDLAGKLMKFHEFNFGVLQWVVGLHIVAILYYRIYKRQKLVGPMITGKVPAELVAPGEAIGSSQLLKALLVALVAAGIVWFILSQAPPPPDIGA